MNKPAGLDADNHEGFAIADMVVDGYRPAFWFTDDLTSKSLKQGQIEPCQGMPEIPEIPEEPELPDLPETPEEPELPEVAETPETQATSDLDSQEGALKDEEAEKETLEEKAPIVINKKETSAPVSYPSKNTGKLPEAGEGDNLAIFSVAVLSILSGLGLAGGQLAKKEN